MEYEIINHGVDNSQYFQGCGTSFTSFEHVTTGCGSSYKEALDDALESMAQSLPDGVEIPAELETECNEADDSQTVEDDAEDCYHYASIRWNNPTEQESK